MRREFKAYLWDVQQAHNYDDVNHVNVWAIIQEDLPLVLARVDALLAKQAD